MVRIDAQGVLQAALALIAPLFDLRRRQIVRAAGFGHRGLALEQVQPEEVSMQVGALISHMIDACPCAGIGMALT
jgi:hypothetical protein